MFDNIESQNSMKRINVKTGVILAIQLFARSPFHSPNT